MLNLRTGISAAEQPIGLIAGQGTLPLLMARGIRAAGRNVACVGLADQYDSALPALCDVFGQAGIVRLGRWVRLLRGWHVEEAVMIGRVGKARMYEPGRLWRQRPDWRAARLWYRILQHDRRDRAVLAAVARELARNGVNLIDSTHYIPEHLAGREVMTRHAPGTAQWADIRFAWSILHRLTELDVGQALAVKERDVIAVEAMEGTDRMIARAGQLCRSGGWVCLKGAGPRRDPRFDVPTVGEATIDQLKRAKAAGLVLEPGRVILADKPAVLRAADKAGLFVVGTGDEGENPGDEGNPVRR